MAGPSLYPILLNRGTTQPPDLYPLFMERDDLVPLRTRIGLVFDPVVIDRLCEIPPAPAPEIDRPAATEIVQDHSVVTFSPHSREPEIRMPVNIKVFSLDSETQLEDRIVSEVSERVSERAVVKVKTRKRSYTV